MTTNVPLNTITAAELEAAETIARETACGVAGCDGATHEAVGTPQDWIHGILNEQFDAGTMEFSVLVVGSVVSAGLYADLETEMTAAEIRATADTFEAFPAWLRSMADKLDALNK